MILSGPGGTSKSYTALAAGFQNLIAGESLRIVIIRSAVEARSIGFLPGDAEGKLEPYMGPYAPLVEQLSPKANFNSLLSSKVIEFHSTSFLRGVTFDNAFVILDEYQNCNAHEIETVVTRVGLNTRLWMIGDTDQTDLRGAESREHLKLLAVLRRMPEFEAFEFGVEDIVRSEFVKSFYATKALVNAAA